MKTCQLKIDYDSHDFSKFMSNFQTTYPIAKDMVKITASGVYKTKRGYHIYLTLSRYVTAEFACFLQIIYHSDAARELLNWRRLVKTNLTPEKWNVLFKKKINRKGTILSQEKIAVSENKMLTEFIQLTNSTKRR